MDEFNQILKQHYETRQLDGGRVNSILESCEPARQIHRWRTLAISGFSIAAAAVVALLLVVSGVFQKAEPNQPIIVEEKKHPSPTAEQFQLIAVKIHADPCGRCKQIAPVFAGLQNEFFEKPVLFLTFDHTSKTSRHQAELLSKRLGIEEIFEKQRYTGVIIVATPDGVVKEIVKSNSNIAAATEAVERSLTSG